jgi:hypothetical protein
MSLVLVMFNSETVTAGIDSFIDCHSVTMNIDVFLKTFLLPSRHYQYPLKNDVKKHTVLLLLRKQYK